MQPAGDFEVFAVPITIANSGARDAAVLSLHLEATPPATSTNVIPAPRGPERPERDQAATHAPPSKLLHSFRRRGVARPMQLQASSCIRSGAAGVARVVRPDSKLPGACSLRSQSAPG
jgi:hypothetical protein